MKMKMTRSWLLFAVLAGGAMPVEVLAQAEGAASPLRQGAYIAPMASYILTDDSAFDNGYGGTFAFGYRQDVWAVEASVLVDRYGGKSGEDSNVYGGTINGLVFPFSGLPNLFGIIGAGGLDVKNHPVIHEEYSLTTIEAGAGYIFPLSYGRYDFGIRADARYRYGHREKRVEPDGDYPIPNDFTDVLLNLGLQLPLGLRTPPPPPAVEPVVVVAPTPPPDSDGDGVADDLDQCPGTPTGTPVDAKGCPLPPPPPPCKTPEPGQRIDLSGCATGDTIVLRGVNFEFDKSTLTTNARTILDGVVDALTASPQIQIEIGGHTDSIGSDSYNEKLSDRRARSVMKYLGEHGIAVDRMTARGYGETQPVADNGTDEGRELNRRVELKITSSSAVK